MTTEVLPSIASVPAQANSMIELLRWWATHYPDRLAWLFLGEANDDEERATYGELDQRARAIATELRRLSVPGERALLIYPPGINFIAAFFGCLYAGIIAVPTYPPGPSRAQERIQSIATDADATIVLTDSTLFDRTLTNTREVPFLAGLRRVRTDQIRLEAAQAWRQSMISAESIAFLQYTSGSTGSPKGVMVTHGNLLHNLGLLRDFFEFSPEHVAVNWLPPYHDMGLIGAILAPPLRGGYLSVLLPPTTFLRRPIRWLQAISTYRGTIAGGPNFGYEWCARRVRPDQCRDLDLNCWDVAYTGSEPIRRDTLVRFTDAFAPYGFRSHAFYPCYGLAEATLIVTGGPKSRAPVVRRFDAAALAQHRVIEVSDDQDGTRDLVASGRVHPDECLVIVDPESVRPCPDGSVGEIWISSPSVAPGYWAHEAETAETFGARLDGYPGRHFLRTGDLGFTLEGQIFVTGRIKDLIIIAGQNHYPQDIEGTVQASHPALRVDGCAAFAVDDGTRERLIVVAEVDRHRRHMQLSSDQGQRSTNEIDRLDDITRAIRRMVVDVHGVQVSRVILVEPGDLPRTTSGKVRRTQCRAQYLDSSVTTNAPTRD